MKIGLYQFKTCPDVEENFKKIKSAILNSAEKNIRLIIFHECSLCGYPPIETPDVKKIDFETMDIYIKEIRQLAKMYNMFIGVGVVRKENNKYYNSIQLIDCNGNFMEPYDKQALWGWDSENFQKGSNSGIYIIDGTKIGLRICFEVRFPEFYRDLFKSDVELCFVAFCDISENENQERYDIIKAHLVTRAVENIMTVISVNSISKYQTAPTGVIDPDGRVILEAPRNEECLLIYDYEKPAANFGTEGRRKYSKELTNK